MKYDDALEELEKVANGKHFALYYERGKYSMGNRFLRIRCYIEDVEYADEWPTFRQALDAMKAQIEGRPYVLEDAEIEDVEIEDI